MKNDEDLLEKDAQAQQVHVGGAFSGKIPLCRQCTTHCVEVASENFGLLPIAVSYDELSTANFFSLCVPMGHQP